MERINFLTEEQIIKSDYYSRFTKDSEMLISQSTADKAAKLSNKALISVVIVITGCSIISQFVGPIVVPITIISVASYMLLKK